MLIVKFSHLRILFRLVSIVVTCGMISSIDAKEIEIRLASWGPQGHFVAQARSNWISELNSALAGRYRIKEYPGGQLYGPKEMHSVVSKGLIPIGVALQPRMMGMVPLLQATYLPFAFDSIDQAVLAYEGEARLLLEQALEEKNLKLLYVSHTGGVHIFSSKGNVEQIADLKGMRLMTTSPMMSQIMNGLGVSPNASIPQSDQYLALKRDVAEATLTSIPGGFLQKTYEVANHITYVNMSFPTVLTVMNLAEWQAMPQDVRSAFLAAGAKQEEYTLAASKAWEGRFLESLNEAGAAVTVMPTEVRDKIKAEASKEWAKWLSESGEEAKRLMDINLSALPESD